MCTLSPDWFTNGSLSFELIKGVPAALVTGLITLGLGYVATRIQKDQWRVARAKLQLDLFEKRYAIFDATWTELSEALRNGGKGLSSPNFTNLIPQAQFLFGIGISDYMREIADKTTQLWLIQGKIKNSIDRVPDRLAKELIELTDWFAKHAMDECRNRFGPYLDFNKWAE